MKADGKRLTDRAGRLVSAPAAGVGKARRMRCPVCNRPARWEENPWRPFCSERCQVTDLGRWAAERYRVPGASVMISPSDPDSDPEPADDPNDARP